MHSINIDIVSDVVCPWCYLGRARLIAALDILRDDVAAHVVWRPYQLNPDIPVNGVDHKRHLADKLGGAEAVKAAHDRLTALGGEDGIAFNFDAIMLSPNTLDCHRLILWAGIEDNAMHNDMVGRLFKAYFEEGQDLTDRGVLVDLAEAAGLNRALTERLLATDADCDTVQKEIDAARQMGITGVPCFILADKYAVSGAQPTQVLVNAIRQIITELSS